MPSLSFRHRIVAGFLLLSPLAAWSQNGPKGKDEIAWAIRNDPKTFDPAKVDEQASETVRFLTGGVLIRTNRSTQKPEPELAQSWKVSADGRSILFHLRSGLTFSDGAALSSRDVAWSLRRVLDPATAAPVSDEFLVAQKVIVEVVDPLTVIVHLPKRVVGIEQVFDEIAIEPAGRTTEGRVTSGPFTVVDYKRGQFIHLARNPNYWRHDASGAKLPYLAGIRLDILASREKEMSLFVRGDYDLMDRLAPDYFGLLAKKSPGLVVDLGASLNTEEMWFNQAAQAPLPDFEKTWFQSRSFRVAVSQAIHRNDLARIAYDGRATPAFGFISPANRNWHNDALQFPHEDVSAAVALLTQAGFHKKGSLLYDAGGHAVKFSILTNAGNAARLKMATLMQQDLAILGMQVTVVTLDFPALIDRLMHKQDYEACLLGLSNVEIDPNSQMNMWLSSSPNHQWNPSELIPATAWEAEVDRLMREQATTLRPRARKVALDKVQQIIATEQPFIYLVYPNALYAVSPKLRGVRPSILQPGLVWNIEELQRGDRQ